MKKQMIIIMALFSITAAYSQDLVIPPEMYYLTNQLEKIIPNNRIVRIPMDDGIFAYGNSKKNPRLMALPIFTHWNFSGLIAVCAETGYLATKKDNKWTLKYMSDDIDPVCGMIIFTKDYKLLFEEGYGIANWIIEAYWLTDKKLVAIGRCPDYSKQDMIRIFFYVYELLDDGVKRTAYEYENRFGSKMLVYQTYFNLRKDYFN